LESRRTVLETLFAGEFSTLMRLLSRIAAGQWQSRDFAGAQIERALKLYLLHFPVYRTYVGRDGPSARDRETIAYAIDRARTRRPAGPLPRPPISALSGAARRLAAGRTRSKLRRTDPGLRHQSRAGEQARNELARSGPRLRARARRVR